MADKYRQSGTTRPGANASLKKNLKKAIFLLKKVDKTFCAPYLIVCPEKERVQGKTAVFDQPEFLATGNYSLRKIGVIK
ncbi:MAG: hypothetical protein WBD16_16060 [Pyrinomonadaceae bacterium]